MVTNNFTPYTGGVVSSIRALVDELQKSGHSVMLITLDFTGDNDDPSWVKRIYCPIRFMYKTNHMAIPWRAKSQIADIMVFYKPDIVHVHHPFLLGSTAYKLARSQQIPVVFTYHTIYEAYAHYVPLLPRLLTADLIKRQALYFCTQVDGIIAPSSYINDYITQYTTKPTVTIPSGLQPQFLGASLVKESQNEQIKLLVVSRMVKEKNIEAILNVAQKLSQNRVAFRLVLIGYGCQYAALQSYAYQTLHLSPEHVLFVHKPAKEIIIKAYQEADLFLFSSTTDTQAIVLAEAMAHGTPVIALDGPGQRDIIKDGLNGYIVQTVDQMAELIKQLAFNRVSLEQLSNGARKTSEEYHPAKVAERCVQFYSSFFCS
jgi:glycosyltransferase involved in cell wall biosynthesis